MGGAEMSPQHNFYRCDALLFVNESGLWGVCVCVFIHYCSKYKDNVFR